METIGDRINKLLKEEGYTQKELANLVGVTEASMSRYINNEREPRIEVIANLATALNTTSDYLINGSQNTEEFSTIKNLVARGAKNMSQEQKLELMRLLV